MAAWAELADEIIRDAMAKGDFANLPGAGRPLQLPDDSNVPEELRVAHKLLRDNDLAPEWIMDSKALDAALAHMRDVLRRGARAYRMRYDANAPVQWARAQQVFRELAARYNRQALSFNLRVPPGVTHKAQVDVEAEILRALDAA